jgi:hypothetical protein
MATPVAWAGELPLAELDPPPPGVGYSGTLLYPDGRERRAGEVEVAGGLVGAGLVAEECTLSSGGGCSTTLQGGLAAGLRSGWSPGLGFRLDANVGMANNGRGIGDLALSWSARVSTHFRYGLFVAGAGMFYPGATPLDPMLTGGLLVSGSWTRVAFDAAIPAVLVESSALVPVPGPVFSEVGVSFAIAQSQALRLGLASFLPGLGWQYAGHRLIARVDLHSLGIATLARGELGYRW